MVAPSGICEECDLRDPVRPPVRSRDLAVAAAGVSRKQLERVLREYVEYPTPQRPPRARSRRPPLARPPPASPPSGEGLVRLRRRDRLGGLLHEYELAA